MSPPRSLQTRADGAESRPTHPRRGTASRRRVRDRTANASGQPVGGRNGTASGRRSPCLHRRGGGYGSRGKGRGAWAPRRGRRPGPAPRGGRGGGEAWAPGARPGAVVDGVPGKSGASRGKGGGGAGRGGARPLEGMRRRARAPPGWGEPSQGATGSDRKRTSGTARPYLPRGGSSCLACWERRGARAPRTGRRCPRVGRRRPSSPQPRTPGSAPPAAWPRLLPHPAVAIGPAGRLYLLQYP